nr:hypothetical protein OG999_49270 [Streptomyces sp. NBC_00886]
MSAGHTVRRSLRAGRVRIALGATAAAATLAMGGTFTAHADTSAPAPKAEQVSKTDVCAEPDPVDAVPTGNDTTPKENQAYYEFGGGDPVDAVPSDGDVCAEPDPGNDPVDAVPGGSDTVQDHAAAGDARLAPAKR